MFNGQPSEEEIKKFEQEMRAMMAPIQANIPQAVIDGMKANKIEAIIVIAHPDGSIECLPVEVRPRPPPRNGPNLAKGGIGNPFMNEMDSFQREVERYNEDLERAEQTEIAAQATDKA